MAESSKEDKTDLDSPKSINPLQLVNVIHYEKVPFSSLMHVKIAIGSGKLQAMVDFGAMNNFIAERL